VFLITSVFRITYHHFALTEIGFVSRNPVPRRGGSGKRELADGGAGTHVAHTGRERELALFSTIGSLPRAVIARSEATRQSRFCELALFSRRPNARCFP